MGGYAETHSGLPPIMAQVRAVYTLRIHSICCIYLHKLCICSACTICMCCICAAHALYAHSGLPPITALKCSGAAFH